MASSAQVHETVSLKEIDRIIKSVNALDEEVDKAMKYAIAATAKMAQRLGNQKMSEEVAMDVTAARRRLRAIKASAGKSNRGGRARRAGAKELRRRGGIWFGLNPMDPIKDFNPSVVGHRAGRGRTRLTTGHGFDLGKSFMGTDKGGSARVFYRKTENRLPIKRTTHDINAKALNTIAGDVWPQVEKFFYNSFRYNLERVIEESK